MLGHLSPTDTEKPSFTFAHGSYFIQTKAEFKGFFVFVHAEMMYNNQVKQYVHTMNIAMACIACIENILE